MVITNMKKEASIFRSDSHVGGNTPQQSLAPCSFVANEEYCCMVYDENDPIFFLSKPIDRKILSTNCSYCTEKCDRNDMHFCEFCGQQICKKCKKTRRFPKSKPCKKMFGAACKMCVKKLVIRDMTI